MLLRTAQIAFVGALSDEKVWTGQRRANDGLEWKGYGKRTKMASRESAPHAFRREASPSLRKEPHWAKQVAADHGWQGRGVVLLSLIHHNQSLVSIMLFPQREATAED